MTEFIIFLGIGFLAVWIGHRLAVRRRAANAARQSEEKEEL